MRLAIATVLLASCAEDPYEPDIAGGERATIEWFIADDGTRHFRQWIDRASGQACRWLDAGDGVLRCLPGGSTPTFYLDDACQQTMFQSLRTIGWHVVDGEFSAYLLGDPFSVTRVHRTYQGMCFVEELPVPTTMRAPVLRLPDDHFATATDEIAAHGRGDLRAITRVGSDGSRMRLPDPFHIGTGAVCSVTGDSLGGWECKAGPYQSDHVALEYRLVGDSRLRWWVLVDPDGEWISPPLGLHDTELRYDCSFELRDGIYACSPPGLYLETDALVSAILTVDP